MNELPTQKSIPWSEVLALWLLPGVLGGLLVFDLVLAFALEISGSFEFTMIYRALILGVVMGQTTLAAVFSSLAPIRYFPREGLGLLAFGYETPS